MGSPDVALGAAQALGVPGPRPSGHPEEEGLNGQEDATVAKYNATAAKEGAPKLTKASMLQWSMLARSWAAGPPRWQIGSLKYIYE